MKRIIMAMAVALNSVTLFAQEKDSIPSNSQQRSDSLLMAHLDIIDQQEIPADTSVRQGVLKNGLTYYVRRCKSSDKKVDFTFLVKGGSIIEKENERGVAHFVEHMMFNGTKHFPGQEAIAFMGRCGLKFGHDSNAFTTHTNVRYLLNSMPNDELVVDSCLLLMRDWACDATLDDKDIESERNVIVEEWRGRTSMAYQMSIVNEILNTPCYVDRSPIGDMEVVKNCSPQTIRDFYKRWYQPQNQAVVVVGDIDADDMVARIKKMFGDLKRGRNTVPACPALHNEEAPRIRFFSKSNSPYHFSAMMMRLPADDAAKENTVGALRSEQVYNHLSGLMLNQLNGMKDKNIVYAASTMAKPVEVKGIETMIFELGTKPADWKKALEKLAKRVEYIRRNGFTDADNKLGFITKPKYNDDCTAIDFSDTTRVDQTESRLSWTNLIINSFFQGTKILDLNSTKASRDHIRSTITTKQVNDAFRKLVSGRNMTIVETFPEGVAFPIEKEVADILNRVKQMKDEELAEAAVEEPKKLEMLHVDSVDINPMPGTVRKTTVLNDSISEVLLSNGVKVVFWKKKIYQNGVKMKLDRPMGFSALSDEDIQYHNMLTSCRRKYKYETSTYAFVSAKPFDDTFDLICRSKKKDEAYWKGIEQQLKMFYASMTTTEVDSVAASEIITNIQNVATQSSVASVQAANRLNCLPFESSKRLMPPTVEEAGRLSVERLRELVKEYYSNFNGTLFLICGDVNQDSIMPLVLKYIGSLPSKPEPVKRLVWSADHYKTTNTTAVEKFSNPSPLCVTALYYTWEKGFQLNQDVRALNHALQSVLGELLMNRIRVQHSDVYTPVCQVVDDLLPVPRMRCAISYTCNPTQRERIAKDVIQLVNEMAEGDLITQELVDNYIKNRENARKRIVDGVDGPCSDYIERELNGIVLKDGDLTSDRKVTPSSLKAHLKQLLKKGNLHVGYMTTE